MESQRCSYWRDQVRCVKPGGLHVWGWAKSKRQWVQVPICGPCFEEFRSIWPEWVRGVHVLEPACLTEGSRWVTRTPDSWCQLPGEQAAEEAVEVIFEYA